METQNISMFLIFTEGLISFFSPCVLPLIPIYLGYLTQNARSKDEDGNIVYNQIKVFIYTLLFMSGIATTFFIIAYLQSTIAKALIAHQAMIEIIGGIFIFLMALLQLDVFKKMKLKREFRLPLRLKEMNAFGAYLLGFTFSFAWTPCIGPMLTSVAVLAASNATMGNLYISVYALGFMIPFLLLGLFTSTALEFIKKNREITRNITKIGGTILLVIGVFLTYTGYRDLQVMTNEQAYESKVAGTHLEEKDFELADKDGNLVRLSDYLGEKVWLSFIASWCPYCNQEITALQTLYEQGYNIVAVVAPGNGRELAYDELVAFMDSKNISYPVLYDLDGQVFNMYNVVSLPMNFGLQSDGNFAGYLPGYAEESVIQSILEEMK